MKIVYFITEGNTDRALVQTLFEKKLHFCDYNNKNEMPDPIKRQVPKYPADDGALDSKRPPLFMHKDDDVGIMISLARGKERIAKTMAGELKTAGLASLEEDEISVAVIVDRDKEKKDEKIKSDLAVELKKEGLILKDNRVCYDKESYPFSLCIVPHNQIGAVEKIILDLSELVHTELTEAAKRYRNCIENDEKFRSYRKDWASDSIIQTFYADKVQVGAITSVLKPDSSPAYMIHDELIHKNNVDKICEISEIAELLAFLRITTNT